MLFCVLMSLYMWMTLTSAIHHARIFGNAYAYRVGGVYV